MLENTTKTHFSAVTGTDKINFNWPHTWNFSLLCTQMMAFDNLWSPFLRHDSLRYQSEMARQNGDSSKLIQMISYSFFGVFFPHQHHHLHNNTTQFGRFGGAFSTPLSYFHLIPAWVHDKICVSPLQEDTSRSLLIHFIWSTYFTEAYSYTQVGFSALFSGNNSMYKQHQYRIIPNRRVPHNKFIF